MVSMDTRGAQRTLANQVNLGLAGNEIETEAQIQSSGGPAGSHRGQQVQAAPAFDAQQIIDDALEAGAGALLRAGRSQTGRPAASAQRPVAKSATSEQGDTGSSTSDDGPEAVARRVATFLDVSRDSGGGGGSGGGSPQDQQQQQQRHATITRIKGASDSRSRALTDRLGELDAGNLRGEQLQDAIRATLAQFSDDPVQQLLALEAVRANGGAYSSSFNEALDHVQGEFITGIDGGQMQGAIRDAYVALRLHDAAQLMRATDPAGKRASMSHQLRNGDVAAKAETLAGLLDWMKETDPRVSLSSGALRDVFRSQMEATGHELSTNEAATMDSDHLGSVLTEIAGLKLLNSVYDASDELIRNSRLEESESFNATSVMSFVLGFVADPAPDREEAIDALTAFARASQPPAPAPLALAS